MIALLPQDDKTESREEDEEDDELESEVDDEAQSVVVDEAGPSSNKVVDVAPQEPEVMVSR